MINVNVADDYRFTDGELNNIVYLCHRFTIDWSMRRSDLAVCLMLARAKGEIIGNAGLDRLIRTTCEYVWDHLCGEPEEPTADGFYEHMVPAMERWFENTTQADRDCID